VNIFKILFFLFLSIPALAQYTVSGTIVSEIDQSLIQGAEVYNVTLGTSVKTNNQGVYVFENIPTGTYDFAAFGFAYDVFEMSKEIAANTTLNFNLQPLGESLSEVLIITRKEKIFALKQLKDVEGTAIYAGKKSEVVVMDNLIVNLASGNARQIYAQVVGLNIYENNDAGLQLNIGARGLNPNRTANFNTRQNGYDISADVLGYPESYYTPPAEAIDEIQVVRGAASLQFGTQFGGLINFKLKQPNPSKKIEWISRQSLGSYDLFTSFNSVSGTAGKLSYYAYGNYKNGNDFRPNSQFESFQGFALVGYQVSEKTKAVFEFSYLNYLAQQAGGLTDSQFEEDPTFSNRTRNWFKVDWKLYALKLTHDFSIKSKISLNIFALDASRKSVGFRENRVSQPDNLEEPRELIVGAFKNWGAEGRFLSEYTFFDMQTTALLGAKFYQSNNVSEQGPGTNNSDADFNFALDEFPNYRRQNKYTFPNTNVALFGEQIFNISEVLKVTPGARFEYIKTNADGFFKQINFDNAGNPILNETIEEDRNFERNFLLLGVGISYDATKSIEFYGNVSQNYRSVTFDDIRIVNPSIVIDENIKDENGYTFDLGARGSFKRLLKYDMGVFLLRYNDRLGVVNRAGNFGGVEQFRSNIGDALSYGIESFIDWNINETFFKKDDYKLNVFSNLSITESEYISSEFNNVKGNKVEFIPFVNFKTGMGFGYKNLLGSLQYTYLSEQFTDASNAARDFTSPSGIVGEIPSYGILDASFQYTYKRFTLETGINNLLDNSYFTRRATGYPGPGIIPSQPRTFYGLLQIKL
jgi:Fe(3+) dicitrate transport protein